LKRNKKAEENEEIPAENLRRFGEWFTIAESEEMVGY
jgi:hypothetical protein